MHVKKSADQAAAQPTQGQWLAADPAAPAAELGGAHAGLSRPRRPVRLPRAVRHPAMMRRDNPRETCVLREAELFVMAEQMLVEVLGRIRPPDLEIVLPPMFPGAAEPGAMSEAVARYLRDDASVPRVLAGAEVPAPDVPPVDVSAAAAAACAAARQVDDGDAVVHVDGEDLAVRDYLLRATLARSLLAHYVAAYLGSTACPLPEELARPLYELTAPNAETWRRQGWFREPMPLPDHVSWRDRFLLSAGHEPHPLGH